MKQALTLIPVPPSEHIPAGAYVRGTSVAEWFAVISTWGLPAHNWRYFIVPRGLSDLQPAGLLILFGDEKKPDTRLLTHPLRQVGESLFLPADAELHPPVSRQEPDEWLAQRVHFFHPVHGLTGFEPADEKKLADFFQLPDATENEWAFAMPGTEGLAPLRTVELQAPPLEELMNSMSQGVGKKKLSEMPGVKKKSGLGKGMNRIAEVGAGGLLGLVSGMVNLMPVSKNPNAQKHWLQNLQDRLSKLTQSLKNERDEELSRLMKLFKDDPDEALKYALPLSSLNSGRGTASPGSKLSRNSTDFNLRNLGGGQAVDGWDIGNFESLLSTKYYEAASAAQRAGDYRKAAYIYAHLLGDANRAAGVLEQGNHYYEAALLWRDYLKNPAKAADLFEAGGYFNEALAHHTELNNRLAMARLFMKLNRQEEAIEQYRLHAAALIAKHEFLQAGEFFRDKLQDHSSALDAFLQGWEKKRSAAACITQYLRLMEQQGTGHVLRAMESLPDSLQDSGSRVRLAEVMRDFGARHPEPLIREAARRIAYLQAAQLAGNGLLIALNTLPAFSPQDAQLRQDVMTHLARNKKLIQTRMAASSFRIDDGLGPCELMDAIVLNHQLIALAKRQGSIILMEQAAGIKTRSRAISMRTVASAEDSIRLIPAQNDNRVFIIADLSLRAEPFTLDEEQLLYAGPVYEIVNYLLSVPLAITGSHYQMITLLHLTEKGLVPVRFKTVTTNSKDPKAKCITALAAHQPLAIPEGLAEEWSAAPAMGSATHLRGKFYLASPSGLAEVDASGKGVNFIHPHIPLTQLVQHPLYPDHLLGATIDGFVSYQRDHTGAFQESRVQTPFMPKAIVPLASHGLVAFAGTVGQFFINRGSAFKMVFQFTTEERIFRVMMSPNPWHFWVLMVDGRVEEFSMNP